MEAATRYDAISGGVGVEYCFINSPENDNERKVTLSLAPKILILIFWGLIFSYCPQEIIKGLTMFVFNSPVTNQPHDRLRRAEGGGEVRSR